MANRLIRAPARHSGFEGHVPVNPEEEHWRMEGADPEVQLFGAAIEQKTAPNWSDYLRQQRVRAGVARQQLSPALEVLREAYPD